MTQIEQPHRAHWPDRLGGAGIHRGRASTHVLSVMVGRMMAMAREVEQPVLVVRAGHDVFASEASVRKHGETQRRRAGRL